MEQSRKINRALSVPAIEEGDMGECCSESCESRSYGQCKERTEIKFPITVICSFIEIKLWGQYLGRVILLTIGSEELIREYGELAGIKGIIFPIAQGNYYVDKHNEPNCYVENRGPWSHQRAAMVS